MGVECNYNFGGKWYSYQGLLETLSNLKEEEIEDFVSVNDIIFSLSALTTLVEKINNIRKKNDLSSKESEDRLSMDGESRYKEGLSVLELIDKPDLSGINGRGLVTPFNEQTYTEVLVKKMVDNGMSEADALATVQKTIDSWDTILKDSMKIHNIFNAHSLFDIKSLDVDFIKEVKEKGIGGLSDNVLRNFFVLFRKMIQQEMITHRGEKNLRNIFFSSKLQGRGNEIFGHIDLMFIDSNGKLSIYIYKTTTTNPNDWVDVKVSKYKYLLAILKAMLANNGINVKNAELNIIPIQIVYNNDFTKIDNILVREKELYSTRKNTMQYALTREDNRVSHLFENNSPVLTIQKGYMENADHINRTLFCNLNLTETGFERTAEQWIRRAPSANSDNSEPLVIRKIDDPVYHYEVIINGVSKKIKDKKSPRNNKEILNYVKENIGKLLTNIGYSTNRVKSAIRARYKNGFDSFSETSGMQNASANLDYALAKYFTYTEDTSRERKYDWELMDDLSDANILMFKRMTGPLAGTIDVVCLTSFDLNVVAKFNKSSDCIMGNYIEKIGYNKLLGNYGNIELVRTMELLNEFFPSLEGTGMKLGNITVVDSNKFNFRTHNIGSFNRNYFQEILTLLKREVPLLLINNNFVNANFVSYIDSILDTYNTIMDTSSTRMSQRYKEYGFDNLKDAKTKEEKKKWLFSILESMLNSPEFHDINPQRFKDELNNSDKNKRTRASLLNLVIQAYLDISGEVVSDPRGNKIEKTFLTSFTLSDPNMKVIVNNLQVTHNTISDEFLKVWEEDLRPKFFKFYEDVGYTALLNNIIGNQTALFSNLFDTSEEGLLELKFKNPYDMSNNLTPSERELLKIVLYQIRKIHTNGHFVRPSNMIKFILDNPDYLWVPLKRASTSSALLSIDGILARFNNALNRVMNISERYDEFVLGIDLEERAAYGSDSELIYNLSLKNPYANTMPKSGDLMSAVRDRRITLIEKRGANYFEHNVENIMVDFLFRHIATTLMLKYMIGTKAFLMLMHLTGNFGGNERAVLQEIEWIEKYLKLNVFNLPIMSKAEKAIMGIVLPIRRLVSHMILGANVVSWFRDLTEGCQQNFMRSIIKHHTELKPTNVAKAYLYVTLHARHNGMAINLISQLCLKYRLSNIDVGRISERAHSGRNGIFNFSNWMYGTLRSPDFHNRMVLFIAQCILDGVIDIDAAGNLTENSAYYLDKDNKLKYDWRKDKRFSALALKNVNSPEYKKQKELYLANMRLYKLEHPSSDIDINDDLPEPYSQKRVMSLAATADNIYGAYDRSKKAMYENQSYGLCLGMFTTWMNGIVSNYGMSALESTLSRLLLTQSKDDNGNLLFYTEDGLITTENTGLRVLDEVPVVIQGIIPTLSVVAKMIHRDGLPAVKEYLSMYPLEKANLMKFGSDILMWLLLTLLFNEGVKPAYKQIKKDMVNHSLLTNAATEIVITGASRSFDLYGGPLTVFLFLGNNLTSPIYEVPTKLLSDTYKVILGEKNVKYLIWGNTGLARSFRDAAYAEIEKNK